MDKYTPEYVDFKIAPYAIIQIMLMLHRARIYDYAITQEDNDLHIRISYKYLEEIDHENFTGSYHESNSVCGYCDACLDPNIIENENISKNK